MITQQQYEYNELTRHHKEIQQIEKSPLADRKEGKQAYKQCLENDLGHFARLVSFLLDGSYGCGAKLAFSRLSKRSNRRAAIFILLGLLEFKTSNVMARKLWHELDTDLQAAINAELDEQIKTFDEDNK